VYKRQKLFHDGQEIPVYVSGRGTLGAGEWLEFVGQASDSLYRTNNRYLLTTYKGRGDRVDVVNARVPKNATPATTYRATKRIENDKAYDFSASGDDPWYDFSILAWGRPQSETLNVQLDDVVPGGAAAALQAELWGVTDFPTAPDHHVALLLNDEPVGESRFDGRETVVVSGEVSNEVIIDGTNTVEVNLPFDLDSTVQFDLVHFNAVAIEYSRYLRARNSELDFAASGEAIEVSDVGPGEVSLYRVDGAAVSRLEGFSQSGHTVTFAGTNVVQRYLLATSESVRTPTVIEPVDPEVGLFAQPAEYLVISHGDFINGIGPLADARRADYSVAVVDVADVYAVYSDGVVDPDSCLLYTSPSPRDRTRSRMPSSA